VSKVLADHVKDREVVETQTAVAVVEKVWQWGKLFAGVVGVAVALFVATLAVVGYTKVADLDKEAKAAKEGVTKAADGAAKDLQAKAKESEVAQKEFVARLEQEKKNLDALSKDLPQLTAKVSALTGKADALQREVDERLARLDKKVTDIQDRFGGVPLPAATQDRLKAKLKPYQDYLGRVGFAGAADDLPLYQTAGADYDSFYMLEPAGRIVLGRPLVTDRRFLDSPDALYREFTHHVLLAAGNGPGTQGVDDSGLAGIEYGLADYYVASFANDPALYKSFAAVLGRIEGDRADVPLRTIKNDKMFDKLSGEPSAAHKDSEVWSGAFWALRERLGQEVTDRVLRTGWKAIRRADLPDGPGVLPKLVRDRVVEAAKALDGGRHVAAIREVFGARGVGS
jgi:hypothetical protein